MVQKDWRQAQRLQDLAQSESRTQRDELSDAPMINAEKILLNAREKRVLEMLFRTGASNREIAEELVTSEQVVKNYFKSIYDKLQIRNQRGLFPLVIAGRYEIRSGPEPGGTELRA